MKVSEKRAILSAHGKDATGKNAELTKRIEELCEEKGSPLPKRAQSNKRRTRKKLHKTT